MRFLSIVIFVGAWVFSSSNDLKIAAFNVQIFGQSKVQKQPVVDELVKIVSRYDLILIQEIRDSKGTAIVELFNQVNTANDDVYSYVISARLGRTTSKEQYCFFYKHDRLSTVDEYVYSDPGDIFEREPYNVRFRVTDSDLPDFVASAIHTSPDDAVIELSRMVNAYEDIVAKWGLEDVIIMGDFNADCNYVRKSKWPDVRLRTDERFQWYISDEADTTVGRTDCAYDRFAVAGEDLQQAVDTVAVFNFETEYCLSKELAEDVSDHYPIEMTVKFSSISGRKMKILYTTLGFAMLVPIFCMIKHNV